VLKDDELRAIVLANSINLSLKSSDEQQATILQFQNFLKYFGFSNPNIGPIEKTGYPTLSFAFGG